MSGGRTALRCASLAVAASWLAAGLALVGSSAPSARVAARSIARIEPVAIATEEHREAPEGARPPAREPEPAAIGAAEIARGGAILDAGTFPVVVASYADFASFRDYALAMTALGARLAVVRERRIVGSVDVASGEVDDGPIAGSFSPRARDYSDEPGLERLARAARDRFGSGAEVRLLVPRAIDAGIFGAIAAELSRDGGDPGAFREVHARYVVAPRGGVGLVVDSALRPDGSRLPLDLLLDLDAIVAAGRAEPAPAG